MFDQFMQAKQQSALVESAMDTAIVKSSPRASSSTAAPAAGGYPRIRGRDADEAARESLLPAGTTQSDGTVASHAKPRTLPGGFALASPPASVAVVAAEPSWLGRIVVAPWFSNLATGMVLVNMTLMCMPYEGMSDEYAIKLEDASTAITIAFMVEMALKLCGLGCGGYWADGWNVLDGTIVLISTVDLAVEMLAMNSEINLSFLRILRMLRVLRVLRLMKSWSGLYRIVISFLKALPQLGNMFVLLVLTLTIFALMGMQLFGGKMDEAHGYSRVPCPGGMCADPTLVEMPRTHFDYFMPAMLTSFVLLTGTWADAMVPAARATGPEAAFFFIGAVIIGLCAPATTLSPFINALSSHPLHPHPLNHQIVGDVSLSGILS